MRRVVTIAVIVLAMAAAGLLVNGLLMKAPAVPIPGELATADPAFREMASHVIDAARDKPRDAERRLELGMVYEAHQFMQLAESCYGVSADLGGGARALYHLAVVRSRMGDIPGAIDAMERTIAQDASHGPAHWRLGFWLLDANRLDEAERAFRDAMSHRIGPFDLAGELGLARVLIARGELDRAQAILMQTAQRPSPYAAYASHLLGTVLARKGAMAEAKVALSRGRASEPAFPDPLHEQINAFRTDAEWLVMQAKSQVTRGGFDQAIALLERAARDRPGDAFVLNNLAIAYVGAQQFDKANALLETMLADAPGSYQGHFNLALAAHAQSAVTHGETARALREEAITHLDRSLELNPTFGGALGMKADLLREDGRHEEALELYFRGLATEPASAMWWRGAALAAASSGRIDEALACAQQLEALRPGDPQVEQLRAQIQSMRRPGGATMNVPVRNRSESP